MNAHTLAVPTAHAFNPQQWLDGFTASGGCYTATADGAVCLGVVTLPGASQKQAALALIEALSPAERMQIDKHLRDGACADNQMRRLDHTSNGDECAARREWDQSVSHWQQANEAFDGWEGEGDIPSSLCNARDVAWRAMLDTPAPDMAALKLKLAKLLKVEPAVDQTNAWDGAEVRQTLADIGRLLGEA